MGSYASAVALHPNGAVASYTRGNGIAHQLTQNARGLPQLIRDVGVQQDQYGYDANGNVTSITDQQLGIFSRSMGYDGLDRLTSASAPNVWGSATYTYDTADNLRTANVGSRSVTLNYTDGTNRLNSLTHNGANVPYTYDVYGNIRSKGPQTFGFDLGNRLTSSSLGGGYVYDGLGRRVRVVSTDGSTRIHVYSQAGQLIWSTSTGGPRPASRTAYLYLGGKQIAEWNSASGVQYLHTDVLGSPVARSNASAVVINRTRFEPYGYVAQGGKPSPNIGLTGFTGHVQDAETDLVYMQQRYYDPIAGRFLSVDPVVADANTGKGFGLYTYVDNNPYAKIDPDGRFAVVTALPPIIQTISAAVASNAGVAVVGVATGVAIGAALNSNGSQGGGKGEAASPPAPAAGAAEAGGSKGVALPSGLVGAQDGDARQQGNRHNSGPLSPANGGTGNAQQDFGKLTGGTGAPPPEGSKLPAGSQVGSNGVVIRPETGKSGARIDIPANGAKPHETLHYPKS